MMESMRGECVVELEVFVEAGCEPCERAVRLAQEVDNDYPQLAVRLVDLSESATRPEEVFAVPTFMLNGRVLSLGNPQRSRLRGEIEALLRGRGLV